MSCNSYLSAQWINRVGINLGTATQSTFPFNLEVYDYSTQYVKVQLSKQLKGEAYFRFEILAEPSIYWAKHQLLDENYIQPSSSGDTEYLMLRELYTQERSFQEFALNLGILARAKINTSLSYYGLISVGPMISTAHTERLKKGFAFSDIFGLGFSLQQKQIQFDLRLTLRHNSNANLSQPNAGHNSSGIELGINFLLQSE